jgi:hypothetical protein
MRQDEHQIQCAIVDWFSLQYPALDLNFYANANGGHRHILTAVKLKREGVKSGVADLFLAVPNKYHHGLYIEVKTLKGVLSDKQKAFRNAVLAQDYAYAVVRSLDRFIELIKNYFDDAKF